VAGDRTPAAEPRLGLDPRPAAVHRTRRFRFLFLPITALALAGVITPVVSGNITLPAHSTVLLDGETGSKSVFFQDPDVQRFLMKHHIQVRVRESGSQEIAGHSLDSYDFAFPSGLPAALSITDTRRRNGAFVKAYGPFVSPLVLATYREYARTLEDHGVVTAQPGQGDTPYYYTLHLHEFLNLVSAKTSWDTLGIGNYGLTNGRNVLARTSNICKTNAALSYVGIVAYDRSPGRDHIPLNHDEAIALGKDITPLLVGQGLPGENLDKLYLTPEGKSVPIVVMYEHQYLAYQIAQAQAGKPDPERVLLYPDVAFQTEPEFIALNDRGIELGDLLADPELRRRATELGFRVVDPTASGQLAAFLTSRGVPAPPVTGNVTTASLPAVEQLTDLRTEVGKCAR
jgi:hypothetical protein